MKAPLPASPSAGLTFRPWKRALLLGLMVAAAACESIGLPRLVFDPTATPPPPVPTAQPLPLTSVTFRVRVPGDTPSGSAPAISLIDEVSGSSLALILLHAGGNVWQTQYTAPLGAVLRYKYIRPLPSAAEEVTPARQAVPYRLLAVNADGVVADDTVAAWSDTPFTGEVGSLSGVIRNSNTGLGAMGVLVAAGGKVTLTAWDGSYTFLDLPTGTQRVTLLAPDGSLRPASGAANVGRGQSVSLDLASPDPNAVHVTFVVRPPPNTDSAAVLRLAGNVTQMGDSFVLDSTGSAIAAFREPVLYPLADGRWATTLVLYEGTHLRYKYTLGDGFWNGELKADGTPRLRELVVPFWDVVVEDAIETWHTGLPAIVTFEMSAPPTTQAGDSIAIQFRPDIWRAPLPMWPVGGNNWKFILYNPTNMPGSVYYRYCRNAACGRADDASTAGSTASGLYFTPTLLPQDLKYAVANWQWMADAPLNLGPLPAVNGQPDFAAGVDFADAWQANDLPFYLSTLRSLPATGANWVTFTRRGLAVQMNPTPLFADDPALAPLLNDWRSLVDQAHNAGLRVSLHPTTCAYTPYGICDYWNGAPYGPDFWNRWFAAYERYMLTQAELAARTATDMLVIGDFKLRPAFPGEPEAPADAEARWRGLINSVRARYHGRIAFEFLMGESVWPNTPVFLDSVDVIRLFWWSPLSTSLAPSAGDMAAVAGGLMDAHLLPIRQRFNRPLHISAAYYSADGAATQCLRRPDGQCHLYEDFEAGRLDPAAHGLDLYEQADIYQGLLTAVHQRDWIMGFSAFGYNPAVTLRDKSISVRGKPAEAVLSAWYPKLIGR